MTNYKKYIPLIVAALRAINPYKIYLFGSVVRGDVTEDSDIDIVVILDSERIHKTYSEKIKTKVQVRKLLMDISHQVPIDILVYSRPEYLKLREINPWFVQEIEEKGDDHGPGRRHRAGHNKRPEPGFRLAEAGIQCG